MRRLRGSLLLGAGIVVFAYGCYSSVADVSSIEVEDGDSGLGPGEKRDAASCTPRKPWEGVGVTGFLRAGLDEGIIFSGDAYYRVKFSLESAENPTSSVLGTIISWGDTGHLSKLWPDAPATGGVRLWDDPGVTAAYTRGAEDFIVSRHLRWIRSNGQFTKVGFVTDDWIINDGGPPEVEGRVPWNPPGVTATYFSPVGTKFVAISEKLGWERDTKDGDPRNWKWLGTDGGAYKLESSPASFIPQWSKANSAGGQKPYDGKGVTAGWFIGGKFFAVSADRMWTSDGTSWTGAWMLNQAPGWANAPSGGCAR